jgi:hypothetical protein
LFSCLKGLIVPKAALDYLLTTMSKSIFES